jgi:ATP-dependent DNA helicase RecG
LTDAQVHHFNQLISNAADQLIRPSIYPQTQVVLIDGKKIIVIYVAEGVSKPYCDNKGVFWVKSGSDKHTASAHEILRLAQESELIHLDEMVTSAKYTDIDLAKFYAFFEKKQGVEFSSTGLPLEQVLVSMNLAKTGKLTLTGLLLFGNNVQNIKPHCLIRAVSFYGNEISDDQYIDKRDCTGTLEEQYKNAMSFLKSNLAFMQSGASFNSPGKLEIDEKALEEAVVNALFHRDYSRNSVIRILIFKNRVEIISPGKLSNNLSIDNIKNGTSVMRNPLLTSHGSKILPYSGLASGIPRIIKNQPNTDFKNDISGEQFTVIFHRAARG